MRIFISHSFADEDLALKLKQILLQNKQIITVYMAQKEPDFEIEISDKITREIQNSDYLVAMITKASNKSPSVHQEFGFAQGVNTLKIPLVEKGATKGVLLEGRDNIEFDRTHFENSCKQVLEHILENGPRRKYTLEEAEIARRSPHYREVIQTEVFQFLDSIVVYMDLNTNDDFFYNDETREKGHKLLEKFIESRTVDPILENFELRIFIKIYDSYKFLLRIFDEAKRFPHDSLFVEEQDAMVELHERILENSGSYMNVLEILNSTFEFMKIDYSIDYSINYKTMILNYPKIVTLQDHMRNYWYQFRIIVKACIKLDREFLKLHKKFGNLAFKSTYGDD